MTARCPDGCCNVPACTFTGPDPADLAQRVLDAYDVPPLADDQTAVGLCALAREVLRLREENARLRFAVEKAAPYAAVINNQHAHLAAARDRLAAVEALAAEIDSWLPGSYGRGTFVARLRDALGDQP